MYFSPVTNEVSKSRREITRRAYVTYGRNTKCVQDFGGKNGRKWRYRWENNTKTELENKTRLGQRSPGLAMVACCAHDNELSGFVQCGEFLDYLKTWWLQKN
jgi:hypothetical protein